MERGVEVWIRDPTALWEEATIVEKKIISYDLASEESKTTLKTSQSGKSETKIQDTSTSSHRFGVLVQYDRDPSLTKTFEIIEGEDDPADIKLRNAKENDYIDDLTGLQHLHEPAILYSLQERYKKNVIYTFTGPILIAVNPFKDMKDLYSKENLELYLNYEKLNGFDNNLKPHAYSIAGAAYGNMMSAMKSFGDLSKPKNQSILISGESGAGKTESTKIVLGYLTQVSSHREYASAAALQEQSTIMNKILSTNPILEAFGNAKTNRNKNSSRFGKFIEMSFDGRGRLIGGNISTYLLEKVRLPKLQAGERNYHIFYQMASGASVDDMKEWGFDGISYEVLKKFRYTSQGGEVQYADLDDLDDFKILHTAFKSMEITSENQISIFHVLAGILHFGELEFIPDSEHGSQLSLEEKNQYHLNHVCRLWGVEAPLVEKTLTRASMPSVRNEVIEKRLSPIQAVSARDSLAKAIYSKLFDWIVNEINRTMIANAQKVVANIGVLDIFGFEIFAHNSFEQLCINYANEALQQQFNEFVFKAEQLEYQRENIGWSFIQFPDCKDRLDLIEGKPLGLLAIIDDFCLLPKPTDERLSSVMGDKLRDMKLFELLQQSRKKGAVELPPLPFLIRHFAGEVIYSFEGFVEKNRDELPKESYILMQSSRIFLKSLFQVTQGSVTVKFQSVGSQFKEQLRGLMTKISATAPHYIRCLKPNDLNTCDIYDRPRIIQQLRYCGVLEVCRVSRSGFHVRYKHADFLSRYLNLVTLSIYEEIHKRVGVKGPKKVSSHNLSELSNKESSEALEEAKNLKALCTELISIVLDKEYAKEKLQIGNTKVFLRKKAHDLLEKMLSLRLRSTLAFQTVFRSYITRKRFIRMKSLVVVIQCAVRSFIARKLLRRFKAEAYFKKKVLELTMRNTASHLVRWYRYRVKEKIRWKKIYELTFKNNCQRIKSWYLIQRERIRLERERLAKILELTRNNNAKRIESWYIKERLRQQLERERLLKISEITRRNNCKRIKIWYLSEKMRQRLEAERLARITAITKHWNAKRIQVWYFHELARFIREEKVRQRIREITRWNNANTIQRWYRKKIITRRRMRRINELTRKNNANRIQRVYHRYYVHCQELRAEQLRREEEERQRLELLRLQELERKRLEEERESKELQLMREEDDLMRQLILYEKEQRRLQLLQQDEAERRSLAAEYQRFEVNQMARFYEESPDRKPVVERDPDESIDDLFNALKGLIKSSAQILSNADSTMTVIKSKYKKNTEVLQLLDRQSTEFTHLLRKQIIYAKLLADYDLYMSLLNDEDLPLLNTPNKYLLGLIDGPATIPIIENIPTDANILRNVKASVSIDTANTIQAIAVTEVSSSSTASAEISSNVVIEKDLVVTEEEIINDNVTITEEATALDESAVNIDDSISTTMMNISSSYQESSVSTTEETEEETTEDIEEKEITPNGRKSVTFGSTEILKPFSTSHRSSLSKIFDAYSTDNHVDEYSLMMTQSVDDVQYVNEEVTSFQDMSLEESNGNPDLISSPSRYKRLTLQKEFMSTPESEPFSPQLTPGNVFKSPSRRMSHISNMDENLRLKRGESSALDLAPVKYFSSKLQKLYAVQNTLSKLIDDLSIPEIKMDEYSSEMALMVDDRIPCDGKKLMTVDEIFVKIDSNQRLPEKILILGDSGVGKTTLLSNITHRWGNHDKCFHNKFNFVFKIKCHLALNEWKEEYSSDELNSPLSCLIHSSLVEEIAETKQRPNSQFSTSIAIDKTELFEVIRDYRDSTLLLLDGFDEISSLLTLSDHRTVMIQQIVSTMLEFKYIIVTSRSNGIHEPIQRHFDRVLQIQGLFPSFIDKYIGKYFQNQISKTGDRLKEILKSNKSLARLCKCPLHLTLTCLITATDSALIDKYMLSEKFSVENLYYEMILWFGKRYFLEKDNRLMNNYSEESILSHPVMQTLKEASLIGCQSSNIALSSDEIHRIAKKYNTSIIHVFDVGIFRERKLISSASNKSSNKSIQDPDLIVDQDLTFIHYSFQEYFASIMIKDQFNHTIDKNKAIRFISYNRYNPSYIHIISTVVHMIMAFDTVSNTNTSSKNPKNAQITMLWDALLCNLDEYIDLDMHSRLTLLLPLSNRYKDPSISDLDIEFPSYLQKQIQIIDIEIISNISLYEDLILKTDYSSALVHESIKALFTCKYSWIVQTLIELSEESNQNEVIDRISQKLIDIARSSSYDKNDRAMAIEKLSDLGIDLSIDLDDAEDSSQVTKSDRTTHQKTDATISNHNFFEFISIKSRQINAKRLNDILSGIRISLKYVENNYLVKEELINDLIGLFQQPNWTIKITLMRALESLLSTNNSSKLVLDMQLCCLIVSELKWHLTDNQATEIVSAIYSLLLQHIRPDEKGLLHHHINEALIQQYSLQYQRSSITNIDNLMPSAPDKDHVTRELFIQTIDQLRHPHWLQRYIAIYDISQMIQYRHDILDKEFLSVVEYFKFLCGDENFQIRIAALDILNNLLSMTMTMTTSTLSSSNQPSRMISPKGNIRRISVINERRISSGFIQMNGKAMSKRSLSDDHNEYSINDHQRESIYEIFRKMRNDENQLVAKAAKEVVMEICPSIESIDDIVDYFLQATKESLLLASAALSSLKFSSKNVSLLLMTLKPLFSHINASIRQLVCDSFASMIDAIYFSKVSPYLIEYANDINNHLRSSMKNVFTKLSNRAELKDELIAMAQHILHEKDQKYLSNVRSLATWLLRQLKPDSAVSSHRLSKNEIKNRSNYVNDLIHLLAHASNPFFGYIYIALIHIARDNPSLCNKIWDNLVKYPINNITIIDELYHLAVKVESVAPLLLQYFITSIQSIDCNPNFFPNIAASILKLGVHYPSMATDIMSIIQQYLIYSPVRDALVQILSNHNDILCQEIAEPVSSWFEDISVSSELRCFSIELVALNPNIMNEDISYMANILLSSYDIHILCCVSKCLAMIACRQVIESLNEIIKSMIVILSYTQSDIKSDNRKESLPSGSSKNAKASSVLDISLLHVTIVESLGAIALSNTSYGNTIVSSLTDLSTKISSTVQISIAEALGKITKSQPHLISEENLKYLESLLSVDASSSHRQIGIEAILTLSEKKPDILSLNLSYPMITLLMDSLSYVEEMANKMNILESLCNILTSPVKIEYSLDKIIQFFHALIMDYNEYDIRKTSAKILGYIIPIHSSIHISIALINELLVLLYCNETPSLEAAEALFAILATVSKLSSDVRFHLADEFYRKLIDILLRLNMSQYYQYQDIFLMFIHEYPDLVTNIMKKLKPHIGSMADKSDANADKLDISLINKAKISYCRLLLKQQIQNISVEDTNRVITFLFSDDSELLKVATEVLIAFGDERPDIIMDCVKERLSPKSADLKKLIPFSKDTLNHPSSHTLSRSLAKEAYDKYLQSLSKVPNGHSSPRQSSIENNSMSKIKSASPDNVNSNQTMSQQSVSTPAQQYHSIEFINKLIASIIEANNQFQPSDSSNSISQDDNRKMNAEVLKSIADQYPDLIPSDHTIAVNKVLGIPTESNEGRQSFISMKRSSFRLTSASVNHAIHDSPSTTSTSEPSTPITPATPVSSPPSSIPGKPSSKFNVSIRIKPKSEIHKESLCNELASSRIEIVKKGVKTLIDQPTLVDQYQIMKNVDNSLRSSAEIKCIVLDVYIALAKIHSPSLTVETIQRLHSLLAAKSQRDDVRYKIIEVLIAIISSKHEIVNRTVLETFISLYIHDKYPHIRNISLKAIASYTQHRIDLFYEYIFHQMKEKDFIDHDVELSFDEDRPRRRSVSYGIPYIPSIDTNSGASGNDMNIEENSQMSDNNDDITLGLSQRYLTKRQEANKLLDLSNDRKFESFNQSTMKKFIEDLYANYTGMETYSFHEIPFEDRRDWNQDFLPITISNESTKVLVYDNDHSPVLPQDIEAEYGIRQDILSLLNLLINEYKEIISVLKSSHDHTLFKNISMILLQAFLDVNNDHSSNILFSTYPNIKLLGVDVKISIVNSLVFLIDQNIKDIVSNSLFVQMLLSKYVIGSQYDDMNDHGSIDHGSSALSIDPSVSNLSLIHPTLSDSINHDSSHAPSVEYGPLEKIFLSIISNCLKTKDLEKAAHSIITTLMSVLRHPVLHASAVQSVGNILLETVKRSRSSFINHPTALTDVLALFNHRTDISIQRIISSIFFEYIVSYNEIIAELLNHPSAYIRSYFQESIHLVLQNHYKQLKILEVLSDNILNSMSYQYLSTIIGYHDQHISTTKDLIAIARRLIEYKLCLQSYFTMRSKLPSDQLPSEDDGLDYLERSIEALYPLHQFLETSSVTYSLLNKFERVIFLSSYSNPSILNPTFVKFIQECTRLGCSISKGFRREHQSGSNTSPLSHQVIVIHGINCHYASNISNKDEIHNNIDLIIKSTCEYYESIYDISLMNQTVHPNRNGFMTIAAYDIPSQHISSIIHKNISLPAGYKQSNMSIMILSDHQRSFPVKGYIIIENRDYYGYLHIDKITLSFKVSDGVSSDSSKSHAKETNRIPLSHGHIIEISSQNIHPLYINTHRLKVWGPMEYVDNLKPRYFGSTLRIATALAQDVLSLAKRSPIDFMSKYSKLWNHSLDLVWPKTLDTLPTGSLLSEGVVSKKEEHSDDLENLRSWKEYKKYDILHLSSDQLIAARRESEIIDEIDEKERLQHQEMASDQVFDAVVAEIPEMGHNEPVTKNELANLAEDSSPTATEIIPEADLSERYAQERDSSSVAADVDPDDVNSKAESDKVELKAEDVTSPADSVMMSEDIAIDDSESSHFDHVLSPIEVADIDPIFSAIADSIDHGSNENKQIHIDMDMDMDSKISQQMDSLSITDGPTIDDSIQTNDLEVINESAEVIDTETQVIRSEEMTDNSILILEDKVIDEMKESIDTQFTLIDDENVDNESTIPEIAHSEAQLDEKLVTEKHPTEEVNAPANCEKQDDVVPITMSEEVAAISMLTSEELRGDQSPSPIQLEPSDIQADSNTSAIVDNSEECDSSVLVALRGEADDDTAQPMLDHHDENITADNESQILSTLESPIEESLKSDVLTENVSEESQPRELASSVSFAENDITHYEQNDKSNSNGDVLDEIDQHDDDISLSSSNLQDNSSLVIDVDDINIKITNLCQEVLSEEALSQLIAGYHEIHEKFLSYPDTIHRLEYIIQNAIDSDTSSGMYISIEKIKSDFILIQQEIQGLFDVIEDHVTQSVQNHSEINQEFVSQYQVAIVNIEIDIYDRHIVLEVFCDNYERIFPLIKQTHDEVVIDNIDIDDPLHENPYMMALYHYLVQQFFGLYMVSEFLQLIYQKYPPEDTSLHIDDHARGPVSPRNSAISRINTFPQETWDNLSKIGYVGDLSRFMGVISAYIPMIGTTIQICSMCLSPFVYQAQIKMIQNFLTFFSSTKELEEIVKNLAVAVIKSSGSTLDLSSLRSTDIFTENIMNILGIFIDSYEEMARLVRGDQFNSTIMSTNSSPDPRGRNNHNSSNASGNTSQSDPNEDDEMKLAEADAGVMLCLSACKIFKGLIAYISIDDSENVMDTKQILLQAGILDEYGQREMRVWNTSSQLAYDMIDIFVTTTPACVLDDETYSDMSPFIEQLTYILSSYTCYRILSLLDNNLFEKSKSNSPDRDNTSVTYNTSIQALLYDISESLAGRDKGLRILDRVSKAGEPHLQLHQDLSQQHTKSRIFSKIRKVVYQLCYYYERRQMEGSLEAYVSEKLSGMTRVPSPRASAKKLMFEEEFEEEYVNVDNSAINEEEMHAVNDESFYSVNNLDEQLYDCYDQNQANDTMEYDEASQYRLEDGNGDDPYYQDDFEEEA